MRWLYSQTLDLREGLTAGDEGLLLIGTISGAIDILSFSATGAPGLRGTIAEFGDVSRIKVSGAIAYVACDTAGLVIVEASNRMALRVAGTASTLAPARGVTVRLSYVFAATGECGSASADATVGG